jgi:hypothetical protein
MPEEVPGGEIQEDAFSFFSCSVMDELIVGSGLSNQKPDRVLKQSA